MSKSFPGAKVLQDVNVDIKKNDIFGIVGENGAGKSTLMKILTGVYSKDPGGKIFLDGKELTLKSYDDAYRAGIVMLFQEISLIPNLTVAENMFIDKYKSYKNRFGMIDFKRINQEAKRVLEEINIDIDPNAEISKLNVIQRRMCEIAKVFYEKAKIIIMDEPTAPLSPSEVKTLFEIIREIRSHSTVLFISHIFEEILELCDRVLVLRDGHAVGIERTQDINKSRLAEMMVGKDIDESYYAKIVRESPREGPSKPLLRVESLSKEGYYSDVDFELHKGEIMGFAGLLGSGASELGRTVFGIEKPDSGEIILEGAEAPIQSPVDAVRLGVAYLPPDRRNEGLILTHPIKPNVTLALLNSLLRFGLLDRKKEEKTVKNSVKRLNIKTPTISLLVDKLSGGNQQKVMFAKWIESQAKLMIFDSPTVGIDIKTKDEIYKIILGLAESGISVIMISSDFPELLKICDRILTMSKGRVTKEFLRSDRPTEADIVKWMI
jgi:ribose transport system ATP-binding protein